MVKGMGPREGAPRGGVERSVDSKKDASLTKSGRLAKLALGASVAIGVGVGLENLEWRARGASEETETTDPQVKNESVDRNRAEMTREIAKRMPEYEGHAWPLLDPADGQFHFVRLVEPGYVSITQPSDRVSEVSFVIPYKYAHTFSTAEAVNPEDYEKMREFMREEIRKQLAENIIGLHWDIDDYEARVPEHENFSVDAIRLHGNSSPEAGVLYGGVQTIEQGNVQQKNLELSAIRAGHAHDQLRKVFDQMGIDATDVITSITSEELQFTPDELDELNRLAVRSGYTGESEQAIYDLITAYNLDRLTDPETLETLDRLVGEKRSVEVELEIKNGEKDVYLIPLPLIPLLGFGALALARRRSKKDSGPSSVGQQVPESVKSIEQLVEKEVSRADLTKKILNKWTTTDNEIRARMGKPPEPNHAERPRQVFYADLHAVALLAFKEQVQLKDYPHLAWSFDSYKGVTKALDEALSGMDYARYGKPKETYIAEVRLDITDNFDYYWEMIR